ncbi:hypothetical protein GE115_16280 [Agromyces sp. CFH 90414]|uniref:Uncharacterized protein n=1 Tax=Agromyces agglutinans TaxID=2662258 RepID=A0A6I2F7F1_9MICO|nr:hypothetical protein [Agromyces agglutinans]MRG61415.1 hypothetical protein [Agromyces agglutinans]
MDGLAGAGAGVSPDDHDFTVAQDTEFDEVEPAPNDDERPLDDDLDDEVDGLDAERRVDLGDDPGTAAADAD